jgi:hypothetical protein
MNKKSMLYKTLCRALSVKRPHNGQGVAMFTDWLATAVPEHLQEKTFIDTTGNLHIDARTDTKHRTLFVAHVDTVHREDGANKIRKTAGKWYADDAVLGADDGAGVAMLMHMMHGGVAGYYVFTQGEECGGIGARALAKDVALLSQFDRSIAFDRRGIDSVITHQGYGRCCSDTFAQALADELSSGNVLMYLGDDTGVYTDTAEFVDTIPECTNISVGYQFEHTLKEELNIHHFEALAAAVLTVPWDALPTDRDPTVVESKWDKWDKWDTHAYPVPSGGWSTNWWADYKDYQDDTPYSLEMEVEDAIYEAMRGTYTSLINLIAEAVYPEDPALAKRTISRKILTDEVLEEAWDMLSTHDADTVLLTLYDIAYCEI